MHEFRLVHRFPFFRALCLVLGLGLMGCGAVAQSLETVFVALLPLFIAFALFLRRPRRHWLELREDGIYDDTEQLLFEYDDIHGLIVGIKTPGYADAKFPAGTLYVYLDHRLVEFRQLKRACAQDLYQALIDRIPLSGTRDINESLMERLEKDLSLFDDDQVLTYAGRRRKTGRSNCWNVTWAIAACSAIWIAIGFGFRFPKYEEFIGVGFFTLVCAFFTGSIAMGMAMAVSRPAGYLRNSSLVISPRGIALTQGHLNGKLTWEQVSKVWCGIRGGPFVQVRTHARSIVLQVPGTTVEIEDVYDRPLATIHQAILEYWEIEAEA